jgi:hypothetical protein
VWPEQAALVVQLDPPIPTDIIRSLLDGLPYGDAFASSLDVQLPYFVEFDSCVSVFDAKGDVKISVCHNFEKIMRGCGCFALNPLGVKLRVGAHSRLVAYLPALALPLAFAPLGAALV